MLASVSALPLQLATARRLATARLWLSATGARPLPPVFSEVYGETTHRCPEDRPSEGEAGSGEEDIDAQSD